MTRFVKYADEEAGASAAEYALIMAFIALVIIVSITALGANINSLFAAEGNTFSTL